MKRFARCAAVMAGLLIVTAGSQAALANCTHFGAGFPVFQCGLKGFFAPEPAAAGEISVVWWQLGYGNNTIVNVSDVPLLSLEGTGMGPLGTFSGNDSGNFQIVLTDAQSVLPQYAAGIPAGALCSNFENSWSQPGVDGCADNPRSGAADNDDVLNRYYNAYGYYSTNYLIDYPMGILLTESTGKYFAVAFVANRARGSTPEERAANTSEGDFSLADVTNGDANPIDPGKNSVIPWQAVPRQRVDAITFSDPANKQTSDRQLALSWPAARAVSDGSVRPSGRTLNNPGNGVGVADQGDLVRYVVEGAPITTASPDPSTLSFTALTSTTATSAVVTVPPDTAIRLRTLFGKAPATDSISASNARQGKLGDRGFEVVSDLTIIAGPLVSERAINVVASRNKNAITIAWESTSELSATGFKVIGRSGKRQIDVTEVACTECTSGKGAAYKITLSPGDLKGSREIRIRMLGPDTDSPFVPIK